MDIDHIFIFSSNEGKEADDLLSFGLSEGGNRIHPGQGTINRKFYFDNFFLEIVWVHDENEIRSINTSPTRLWERSQFFENNHSRFGLGLVNKEDTDKLFSQSESYQPDYLPTGLCFDIITNNEHPSLPWTFRPPFKDTKKYTYEPTNHSNGIQSLTKADFGIGNANVHHKFCELLNNSSQINISNSDDLQLQLEFDHNKQGKKQCFPDLALTFSY